MIDRLFQVFWTYLVFLSTAGVFAQDKTTELDLERVNAEQLVRRLGADSYQDRQRAYEKLQSLGTTVRFAVEQGLKSEDPEVRIRCNFLLEAIFEAEKEKRFVLFVMNGPQPGDKAFEGWAKYRQRFGSDYKARALFVDLYKFDSKFLIYALENPTEAILDFRNQSSELVNAVERFRDDRSSIEELRAEAKQFILFSRILIGEDLSLMCDVIEFARRFEIDSGLKSQVKAKIKKRIPELVRRSKVNRQKFFQLIFLASKAGMQQMVEDAVRPAFAKSLEKMVTAILRGRKVNNDDFNGVRELTESSSGLVNESLQAQLRPVFKQAVAKMVSVPMNDFNKGGRFAAYRLFQVGRYIELKEVLPLALKITAAEMWSVKTRRNAVNLVGKYGTIEQVESLEKLLGDRTPVYKFGQISSNGVGFTSILGDEALAAMIHLSSEDLAEYGFGRPGIPNPKYQDRDFSGWGFMETAKKKLKNSTTSHRKVECPLVSGVIPVGVVSKGRTNNLSDEKRAH